MKLVNFLSAILVVITYAICPSSTVCRNTQPRIETTTSNSLPAFPASLHVILIRPI